MAQILKPALHHTTEWCLLISHLNFISALEATVKIWPVICVQPFWPVMWYLVNGAYWLVLKVVTSNCVQPFALFHPLLKPTILAWYDIWLLMCASNFSWKTDPPRLMCNFAQPSQQVFSVIPFLKCLICLHYSKFCNKLTAAVSSAFGGLQFCNTKWLYSLGFTITHPYQGRSVVSQFLQWLIHKQMPLKLYLLHSAYPYVRVWRLTSHSYA